MASITASAPSAQSDLSLFRLYVMRAMYLLIGLGEGSQIAPGIFAHEPTARGVIPSLLAGMLFMPRATG